MSVSNAACDIPLLRRDASSRSNAIDDHPLTLIDKSAIDSIVGNDLSACARIVRDAYLAHHALNSVVPTSVALRLPHVSNARIMALPAHSMGPPAVSGIKWIASYPENVRNGVPRASAVIVLNRCDDGFPYAVLEGSVISAARTAASAALAAQTLGANRQLRRLAIIGCGLISRWAYRFLRALLPGFDTLFLNDLSEHAASRFEHYAKSLGGDPTIVVCDALTAMQAADIVLMATIAPIPHLHDAACLDSNPIVLHLSLRDFGPQVIAAADNVTDDVEHVMSSNTSVQLTEQYCGHRRFLTGTIAEYMNGTKQPNRSRAIIFSPFGLGILDIAVAQWVHEIAQAHGKCTVLPRFFE